MRISNSRFGRGNVLKTRIKIGGFLLAIVIALVLLVKWLNYGPPNTGSLSQVPDAFSVVEKPVAWTSTLQVRDEDVGYGQITRDIMALSRSFTWTDGEGKVVATARRRILSWGCTTDVYDGGGALIATVKEKVWESMFKTWTSYSILNAEGQEIAVSDKLDFFGTEFTFRTVDGEHLSTMSKPYLNFTGDHWKVSVSRPGVVDKRVLVIIAASKSSAKHK